MQTPEPQVSLQTDGRIRHSNPVQLPVPDYLQQLYWWAYVHPNAIQVFERDWLVNLILFGNYGRLRDAALAAMGHPISGHILQVACAYGNLTPKLRKKLAADAQLDVVDILPQQLTNLASKLPADQRIALLQGDSACLACSDHSYDQVLLFFLLHEQPENVRRRTLSEAVRVVKPGGRILIIDYHCPARLHPLRPLLKLVLARLEPYAMDLWRADIAAFLPAGFKPASLTKQTWFGGLYQRLVIQC